jgi:HAD superfamily hydrolase (TIGR01509 family)
MKRYTGIIFDIDGTLIDSNDAHARAWVSSLQDAGIQCGFGEVRPLIGMGGDQLLKQLKGIEKSDPVYEALSDGWKTHFKNDEISSLRAQPGAHELVLELQRRGFQMVIGTSGDEALVEQLLEVAGVNELLPERTTASDVEASKPAPDIVQAALKKLGVPAEQAVMIGDTPFDIESARKAGVDSIFLRCGGDDRSAGAIAVFENPQDLLEQLDNSPLGSSGG